MLIKLVKDVGITNIKGCASMKSIAEHGAYINQHLTCIRLNREVLNSLYVAYFMESPAGKEQFESKNQSAVKAGLNFKSINSLRLMVPPMDKQNAFVEFVEQVDKSKFDTHGNIYTKSKTHLKQQPAGTNHIYSEKIRKNRIFCEESIKKLEGIGGTKEVK